MHGTIVARSALALAAALAAGPTFAVQVCELNGEHVNPANGSTTQGKTGLMRCREGDGGPVVREQELQRDVFMGVVRYFKDGALEREHHVNERGNRDGRAREFAPGERGGLPVVIREATYRDGRTVGLARSWHPNGQLRRVSFHGDDDREQASAEFTPQGQLSELRCAPRPLLGPDADDAHWCGHAGGASNVVLYSGKGQAKARLAFDRGERRRSELLWDSGAVREAQELTPAGGVERSFAADGVKRREVQWVVVADRSDSERSRRVTTLDQEHHDSGKLVRERRWRPSERGAELVSEQRWYLNGQPKELVEFVSGEGRQLRRETGFHDNGRKASDGLWVLPAPGTRGGDLPTGIHRSWDADARLRGERTYDERGRITRERELDGAGKVVRDDEVFEDGSRKACGR
jgi:antitoxin component YwqK of YwqJK toxin-antitoxin module